MHHKQTEAVVSKQGHRKELIFTVLENFLHARKFCFKNTKFTLVEMPYHRKIYGQKLKFCATVRNSQLCINKVSTSYPP